MTEVSKGGAPVVVNTEGEELMLDVSIVIADFADTDGEDFDDISLFLINSARRASRKVKV
jgi:hypothetical protein